MPNKVTLSGTGGLDLVTADLLGHGALNLTLPSCSWVHGVMPNSLKVTLGPEGSAQQLAGWDCVRLQALLDGGF